VLDINSKAFKNIKSFLKIFHLYIIEYIISISLTIFIVIPLYFNVIGFTVFLILLLITNSFTFYYLNRKKEKDLSEVIQIIENIRENKYESSNEIVLHKKLISLENSIKRMFEKSKNDIEYMKKLQRARSEFIGNVSHELRTPIFAIQGYIETLLNGAINDPRVNKNFLSKANHHTNNLNNLLNDLINISMIESGEMQMSFRYFELKPYLTTIIEELKHLAEEKNIELILNIVSNNLFIFGDKERLKQVFTNLIHNAIKYTEHGKVELIVEEHKKFVNIIISDTGIGIPEADLDRVFERFYRVDKARSRSVGGTGLGLSIVKHILEAHNTKIYVTSKLGQGSKFSFRLRK
jgi:two-component system phosphate regulon sensor histidine kinase PhoR